VVNANLLRRPNAAHDIARATLELTALPADKVQHVVVTKKLAWTLFNFYWGDKPAHIR
jgi:processive 1,2-diacylglycerol beta-glucosyltransferase